MIFSWQLFDSFLSDFETCTAFFSSSLIFCLLKTALLQIKDHKFLLLFSSAFYFIFPPETRICLACVQTVTVNLTPVSTVCESVHNIVFHRPLSGSGMFSPRIRTRYAIGESGIRLANHVARSNSGRKEPHSVFVFSSVQITSITFSSP